MRVLITGAAGMLGRKLTDRLRADGAIADRAITAIDLADVVAAPTASSSESSLVTDLAEAGRAAELVARRPDVIFHLAGVVSGEAEADFDKGDRVNLDGTRALFDAIRTEDRTPRVVFTSSIAVYGAPLPEVIPDEFHRTPLTSYGTQKLIGEALLADYSRRGFLDGIGIRLPTVTVRPGAPNAAASGFFSGIIREPLAGNRALLPVGLDVVHPHVSPRSAVGFLLHAAALDTHALEPADRNLTMPAVSVSVGEQLDALGRVAGPGAVGLVDEASDEMVSRIVTGWPRRLDAARARALGFRCEASFDEIIAAYLEDDLPDVHGLSS